MRINKNDKELEIFYKSEEFSEAKLEKLDTTTDNMLSVYMSYNSEHHKIFTLIYLRVPGTKELGSWTQIVSVIGMGDWGRLVRGKLGIEHLLELRRIILFQCDSSSK